MSSFDRLADVQANLTIFYEQLAGEEREFALADLFPSAVAGEFCRATGCLECSEGKTAGGG